MISMMADHDQYSQMKKAFLDKGALKKGKYDVAWNHFNDALRAALNVTQDAKIGEERIAETIQYLQHMLKISEKKNSKVLKSYTLNFLGRYNNLAENFEEALSCFQHNIKLAEELKNQDLKGRSFIGIGYALFNLRKYDAAIKSYENALLNAEQTKEGHRSLIALSFIGKCYVQMENWDLALSTFQKAMETGGEIGNLPPILLCSILNGVGHSYLSKGRYEEALANLMEAIGIAVKLGQRKIQADSMILLSEGNFKVGNPDEAIEQVNLAIQMSKLLKDEELIARAEMVKNKYGKNSNCSAEPEQQKEMKVVDDDGKDEKVDSQIVEAMVCPICLEIAEKAVETSCCHHVYCEKCLALVAKGPCPQCRREFEIVTSHICRRIIGNLPVICSFAGCKAKITRSELESHELRCEYRLYQCPAPHCLFEGLKKNYLLHLVFEHEEAILKSSVFLFETSVNEKPTDEEWRIQTKTNEAGNQARLGSTGKHYCGLPLDGPSCSCCDGKCGPLNGCNCAPCMKLDLDSFKLERGWFVNREGCICRVSPETANVYCGRLAAGIQSSEYCGPNVGPSCEACRILQSQLNGRYASIWP